MDKNIRVLVDFGSTFTKVVAIDLAAEEIVARSRVPSTVETDITIGLQMAYRQIGTQLKSTSLDPSSALACSSAAGGLRMVCVGFVPEYTSEAANLAALGAGAKVIGLYSYELDEDEVRSIETTAPDILLLTGGTDGGNTRVILHNARLLAQTTPAVTNIIVAGNKAAYTDIRNIFNSHKRVIYTRNVMPEIGKLDLAPCNACIRDLFMQRIVVAKGIARARGLVRDVIMPTPSAVLEAAKLISHGAGDVPGLGELMVVDTGGATTNVHSIARGSPQRADIITSGLPEPYEKRTVEGDLGLKYNLDTLCQLMAAQGRPVSAVILNHFAAGNLPQTAEEFECHRALVRLAIETAVDRHAGRIQEIYGPTGRMFVQHGKDLTGTGYVIGTGGALVHAQQPENLLEAALFNERAPDRLKPKTPQLLLDTEYCLYAIGLLGQGEPEKACRLARRYLIKIG